VSVRGKPSYKSRPTQLCACTESMEAAPPPSYTSADPPSINTPSDAAPDAPPAYSSPTAFVIGIHTTKPFISAPQIKDHLALLHAFAELKIKVEGISDLGVPHLPSDKDRRWAWFVGIAVERSVLLQCYTDSLLTLIGVDSRNGARRCARRTRRRVWPRCCRHLTC
jgi:hypothetical protein